MTLVQILPKEDAKRHMPVRYNIFWTTFIFSLSNVREVFEKELDAAFDPAFLSAPLVRYADDGLLHANMPLYLRVEWDNASRALSLCLAKEFSTKAARHSVNYCERKGVWVSDGFPPLRLRRHLNHIAKLREWDRAVFQGDDGKPTTDPVFAFAKVGNELRISGTLMGMSEIDFRRTYQIGAIYKRQA